MNVRIVSRSPQARWANTIAIPDTGLWDSTIGYGQGRLFWGDHLLAVVRPSGVISGWLVAAAHIADHWLLEALLSARQGQPHLVGPPHRMKSGRQARRFPPVGFMGAWTAVGCASPRPYLADKGFRGYRWRHHWYQRFGVQVFSVPTDNARTERPWTPAEKRWLASRRQIVETVFAVLTEVFDIKYLRAHSRWGQYTRLAAKMVGYHLGLQFNCTLGRSFTICHFHMSCPR